jgi:hypothetical protein
MDARLMGDVRAIEAPRSHTWPRRTCRQFGNIEKHHFHRFSGIRRSYIGLGMSPRSIICWYRWEDDTADDRQIVLSMAGRKSKDEQPVVLTSHVQIASRHRTGATVLTVDDYSGDGCLSRLCLVRDLVTDGSGSEHQIVESGKRKGT